MSAADPRPDQPTDPDLPGFDELMHTRAPAPVAAVYEEAGTSIENISRIQVSWHPGHHLTARYRIIGQNGGLAGGHDVVAVLGRIPDGAAVVQGPDADVGIWVVPNDPLLPGLRSALDEPVVADLLADLGSTEKVARTRLRAYRPGRRAVVEVQAGRSSVFIKVVPPAEVDDLHARHRFLSDHVAVPDSLGVDRELGLVVMRSLPGVDLRTSLRSGATPTPPPHVIAGMVENLPVPSDGWRTRSAIESLPAIVTLLARLLPEQTERLDRIAAQIGPDQNDISVPVHGDFHEAQILAVGEHPTGLIDVDTFGWGRRTDDAATMLGHLHLLTDGSRAPSLIIELARDLNRCWDAWLDPVDLRLRTAAVVLGLATGPFRVNRPTWRIDTIERIDLAEEWVESARRVDERSLIPTSGTSNPGHRS